MLSYIKNLANKNLRRNGIVWRVLRAPYFLFVKGIFEARQRKCDGLLDVHSEKNAHFFFVQIGANDGVMEDPIHERILKYQWSGVLVEPQSVLYERLCKNYEGVEGLRFEKSAISSSRGFATLFRLKSDKVDQYWQAGLGSLEPSRNELKVASIEELETEEVATITFADLLDKYDISEIDLLQIDTEGHDFEILKTIDFGRIRPKFIQYEHACLTLAERWHCGRMLRKAGYRLIEKPTDTFAFRL